MKKNKRKEAKYLSNTEKKMILQQAKAKSNKKNKKKNSNKSNSNLQSKPIVQQKQNQQRTSDINKKSISKKIEIVAEEMSCFYVDPITGEIKIVSLENAVNKSYYNY